MADTWVAQVDGPGSGLDADTVDGADASGLQKRVTGTCPAASFVNAVASVSPSASMLVALLTYTLQVVLVGVVFAALDRSGALDASVDRTWAGGAVVVATLVWLVSHIISATRSRLSLYDLPERPSEGPEASAR